MTICLAIVFQYYYDNCNVCRLYHSTKDPGQNPFTFKVGLGEVIQGMSLFYPSIADLLITVQAHAPVLHVWVMVINAHDLYSFVGWDEGCMTMKKGEISKITIAGNKGYGAQGFPAWGYPFTLID